jgi:uncharacterized protein DUF2017
VSGAGPEDNADFPHLGEPDDSLGTAGAAGAVVGFRSTRRGVTGWFAPRQARIIRSLVGQVAELLGPEQASPEQASPEQASPEQASPGAAAGAGPAGTGGGPLEGSWDSPEEFAAMLGLSTSTTVPEDPVLARLLPDAYPDDAESASDFRRYTEQDLRSGKVAAARTVLATLPEGGGQVRLSGDDAQVWLRAINDVRLALGVRLAITEDFEERMAQLEPDDPRSAYFWIYDWLTYLQETLVRAVW